MTKELTRKQMWSKNYRGTLNREEFEEYLANRTKMLKLKKVNFKDKYAMKDLTKEK